MLFEKVHYEQAEKVRHYLLEKKYTVGTAESCTGGLLAALCTEFSGSSEWFYGGIVSYDNSVKEKSLHVSPDTLALHGAVSEETALAMVKGCLLSLDVDCAMSITGVAGPSGGTPEKPIGTVWIAVGHSQTSCFLSRKYQFSGDRQSVRLQSVLSALLLLEEMLLQCK